MCCTKLSGYRHLSSIAISLKQTWTWRSKFGIKYRSFKTTCCYGNHGSSHCNSNSKHKASMTCRPRTRWTITTFSRISNLLPVWWVKAMKDYDHSNTNNSSNPPPWAIFHPWRNRSFKSKACSPLSLWWAMVYGTFARQRHTLTDCSFPSSSTLLRSSI